MRGDNGHENIRHTRKAVVTFKRGEKLDEDGEPIMDPGTYVQYANDAEQDRSEVDRRRCPFQTGRSRAALPRLEAKALPCG